MSDATGGDLSPDEAGALLEFRNSRSAAGPVVRRLTPEQEQAALAQFRQEKANSQFISQNKPFETAVDNPDQAGSWERMMASLPVSSQGKLRYLLSRYGQDNVQVAPGGKVIVREPGKDWMEFDKTGLQLQDLAGAAGPAIEAVPQIATGIATSGASPAVSIPAAGAAGAAGNVLRQGIAKLATGEELPSSERALDAGISGGAAMLGEGVIRGVGGAAKRWLTPGGKAKALAEAATARNPAETYEGLALRDEFDVPLTAGQVTKDQDILQKESLQRQIGRGVNLGFEAKIARDASVQRAAFNLADEIAGGNAKGASAATKGLANVRDTWLKGAKADRAEEAKRLFGAVPQDATIDLPETMKALEFWQETKGGKFQTGPGKELVKQIDEWKEDLGDGTLTAKDLQRALETFGAYKSSGDIVKDMSRQEGKKVGGTIFAALNKDLDNAIAADAPGATELRVARDAYRARSQQMQAFDNAVLARSSKLAKGAGGNPASLVDSIANAKAFDAQDVSKTISVAEQMDPELAAQLRGAVVRRFLTPSKGETLGGWETFARIKAPDRQDMLDALFKNQPETRAKIDRLAEVARRSSMGPYREGSQTASVLHDLASSIPIGVSAGGHVAGGAAVAVSAGLWKKASNIISTSEGMTRLLQTKEGVDALFDLARPELSAMAKAGKYGASAVSRALARVAELGATEKSPETTTSGE